MAIPLPQSSVLLLLLLWFWSALAAVPTAHPTAQPTTLAPVGAISITCYTGVANYSSAHPLPTQYTPAGDHPADPYVCVSYCMTCLRANQTFPAGNGITACVVGRSYSVYGIYKTSQIALIEGQVSVYQGLQVCSTSGCNKPSPSVCGVPVQPQSLSCWAGFTGNISTPSQAAPIEYQAAGTSPSTHSCVSFCEHCLQSNDTGDYFTCRVGSYVSAYQLLPVSHIAALERNPQVSRLVACNSDNCNKPAPGGACGLGGGSTASSGSANGEGLDAATRGAFVGGAVGVLLCIIFSAVSFRLLHQRQASAKLAAAAPGQDTIPVTSPLQRTAAASPWGQQQQQQQQTAGRSGSRLPAAGPDRRLEDSGL